jgi:hypothetical protein
MFRKNVTFQLAMILLVVIVSYALNVRATVPQLMFRCTCK